MARQKVWTCWVLVLRDSRVQVMRSAKDGTLLITTLPTGEGSPRLSLTPTEARRLYMKLAGDFRD